MNNVRDRAAHPYTGDPTGSPNHTYMKLSQVKEVLQGLDRVSFQLPSGQSVPEHFHVTEVGKVSKHYIDCGGTVRTEEVISFQLWTADDFDHRLASYKLLEIIALSEKHLQLPDAEVEVEYQGETIGKYDLAFERGSFQLVAKQTDCLAKDRCGVPAEKPRVRLSTLSSSSASGCKPGSGCC